MRTRHADSPGRIALEGMTLFEGILVTTVFSVIMSAMMISVKGSLAEDHDMDRRMEVSQSVEGVLSHFAEVLMTTDSLGVDPAGARFVNATKNGDPTLGFVLSVKRVQGYVLDGTQGVVSAVYSSPIKFYVNAQGHLVEEIDGVRRVLGTGFERVDFEVEEDGAILVRVRARVDRETGQFVDRLVRFYPKNGHTR